jgi:hypothetical protein
LKPKSSALEFSFAQLIASLNAKFNWDPMDGSVAANTASKGEKTTSTLGFDENAWDKEEDDYAPVVVDLDEEDEDEMDLEVDFGGRATAGGHMDMKTGKMVFGS